jgi:LL-diaminopimelate aminotransferase
MALRGIRQFPNDLLKETRAAMACNSAEGAKLLNILGLEKAGFDTVPFIWAKIERRRQAATATALLYRRSRLLAVPGTAFGDTGEGFLRFSLTVPPASYSDAVKRLRKKRKSARLDGEK